MRFMFIYISAIVLYIPTVHSKARNIWTNRHSRYLCDACVVTAVLHRRVDDGQGVNSYIGQNLLEKEVKSEKAKTINLIMKNISASPGFTLTNVLNFPNGSQESSAKKFSLTLKFFNQRYSGGVWPTASHDHVSELPTLIRTKSGNRPETRAGPLSVHRNGPPTEAKVKQRTQTFNSPQAICTRNWITHNVKVTVARCPRHIQSVFNLIAEILINILVIFNWQLSKSVSVDQCHMNISRAQEYNSFWWRFCWIICWPVTGFN